jgi:murein L,D-transpeptidase YcbB/YkuD
MSYRIAKSLATLRDQIDAQWPHRSKISDGWIGDSAHASRKSDHNPDANGIVKALDVTHDPANGVDAGKIAESIKTDPRVSYVIWNRKIYTPSVKKEWRNYTGSNPHTRHVHISVLASKADSQVLWDVDTTQFPRPAPTPFKPLVRKGMTGPTVKELQSHLNTTGMTPVLIEDGIFGPKTERNVRAFQKEKGLVVDGIAGQYTWGALLGDGDL